MICIPITASTQAGALQQIERSHTRADVLELRMDLIRDVNLGRLMEKCKLYHIPVRVLVTNRRKDSSPVEELSAEEQRIALLKEAVGFGADYVDIEMDTPEFLRKEMLSMVSEHGNRTRVIISHHDFDKTPSFESLKSILDDSVRKGGSITKIVTLANSPEDNLTVLGLIPYARNKNQEIIAFCMGEKGRVSRMVAPALGSYLSFASLDRWSSSAPGQLTVDEMEQVMCLFRGRINGEIKVSLSSDTQIFSLFGNPVKQSLSPLMHSAALAEMNIHGKYLPFCIQDLASAVSGVRGMDIRGISVTIPFKVAVMAYLDEVDEDALQVGAVNTIVNYSGRLKGFNTDWIGLVQSLKETMEIKGKVFAVLGAGGAARAAVFGIQREGGIPIVVNRNKERGEHVAQEWGCAFHPLKEINEVRADCLINTTSVGMMPDINESPVDSAVLRNYQWVMDVIYNPFSTKLLKEAAEAGCITIPGIGMFVHQGAEQIKLWTGQEPPREVMRKVVMERLLYGS